MKRRYIRAMNRDGHKSYLRLQPYDALTVSPISWKVRRDDATDFYFVPHEAKAWLAFAKAYCIPDLDIKIVVVK